MILPGDAERMRLLEKAAGLRARIEATFEYVAYWNTHVRRPHEAPVDPDPTGELADMLAQVTATLHRFAQ